MAVEQITPEQKEIATEALKECMESVEQDTQELAQEVEKKIKEKADQISQQLAAIPTEIIKQIQDAIDFLMKIINGYNFPGSTKFDADKIIDQIELALQPVVDALESLPVPEIPGLKQVKDLLELLRQIKLTNDEKKEIDRRFDILPTVPPELISIVNALIQAIQTIATMLPLILINLIFQMISAIIDCFKLIYDKIGVPSIPFPLTIIPDCLDLMPKIFMLIPNFTSKIKDVVEAKIRQTVAKITILQFPELPRSISLQDLHPSCPQRPESAVDAADTASNAT